MANHIRMSCEERRAAIIHAAIRLFAQHGFRGTTTRDIAAAVGVSEPVLYEHFRSKRDLYQAIIESKASEHFAQGTALLQPYIEAQDDRGFFQHLGEFIVAKHEEDIAYTRLSLLIALEGSELVKLFQNHIATAHEVLATYIQARINDGAFRPVDPHVAARTIFGMFSHHAMLTCIYQDQHLNTGTEHIIKEMVDVFLAGITNSRKNHKKSNGEK